MPLITGSSSGFLTVQGKAPSPPRSATQLFPCHFFLKETVTHCPLPLAPRNYFISTSPTKPWPLPTSNCCPAFVRPTSSLSPVSHGTEGYHTLHLRSIRKSSPEHHSPWVVFDCPPTPLLRPTITSFLFYLQSD